MNENTRSCPPEELLIDYAIGEETGRSTELSAHLGSCDLCRAKSEEIIALLEGYRSSGKSEAPSDVLVDLLDAQAALGGRPRRGERRPAMFRLLPAAAAILLMAGGYFAGRLSVADSADPIIPATPAEAEIRHPLPDPPPFVFYSVAPTGAYTSPAREDSI